MVFLRFSRSRPAPARFLRDLRFQQEKLFINPPDSLLRFGSKRHLRLFPNLTVPTIVTRSRDTIVRFARKHGAIVLKPLDSHSGKGIVKVDPSSGGELDLWAAVERHIPRYGTPVVQPYIEQVRKWGDKRINVFAYEVVSVVRTLPADGSFICHRAAGGTEVPAELSDDDAEILDRVIPFLRENQIWWAGIDVIGPYVGEVNIVSPMMTRRADDANGNTDGREAVVRILQQHASRLGL